MARCSNLVTAKILLQNLQTGSRERSASFSMGERKNNPIKGVEKPSGLQEFEAPRVQDNRHMKMLSLSALRTGRLYPLRKYSWYSFQLDAKSTTEPQCGLI
jgi:hypothetical protein